MDFLNVPLPWRSCKSNKADDVRDIKAKCLSNPEEHLWKTAINGMREIKNIFFCIARLRYEDRPDYDYIRKELNALLQREEIKEHSQPSLETRTSTAVSLLIIIEETTISI